MKSERIKTIDFLKGIAIIFVIICHFGFSQTEKLKYGFPFYILLAVGIFMTVSGYVWALSLKKKSQLYSAKTMINRICRFYAPFILVYIIEEVVWFVIFKNVVPNQFEFELKNFLAGGLAAGGYYVPLMLQLTILFPLIFYCINRWKGKGVIVSALINFNFELFRYLFDLPVSIYRLMIFRYLFAISYGIYLAVRKVDKTKKERKTEMIADIIMVLLGFTFIFFNQYFEEGPYIFVKTWACDSMLSHLFTVVLVKNILRFKKINIWPINYCGKISYHIFLTQGLYYLAISRYVNQIAVPRSVKLLMAILICVGLGAALYYIDVFCSKYINAFAMKVFIKNDSTTLNYIVIENKTLDEYEAKYLRKNSKLLKFSKKEVKNFDKHHKTKDKYSNYLLRNRTWWLIGDVYYEIPKK